MLLKGKKFLTPVSASTLALSSLAIALPVHAQETQKKPDEIGEVVVTGIRRQLETSQARKQDATELVDAVTADDIGALPDRSVTEVLQRIPGLAIGRVPQPRSPASSGRSGTRSPVRWRCPPRRPSGGRTPPGDS